MDLETYNDGRIAKTYAIGFYVKNSVNTFYIGSNLDSDELIIRCLNNMLTDTYNGYTFYIHNLTHFDVYFLFRVIISRPDLYDCEPNFRDGDIIGLKISRKIQVESGKHKVFSIRIVDSLNLLNASLSDLCKTFDTHTCEEITFSVWFRTKK